MASQQFAGRIALVTGAARGIGRAIATALGEAGATVALVDLQPPAEAIIELKQRGIDAHGFACDVSDEAQVERLRQDVLAAPGAPHIVVNSAGIAIRKDVADASLAEWNRILATNLTGPFLVSRDFIPTMKGRGYGRIINLTSIMGHVTTAGRGLYSTTKAGLLALTKALALELAADQISVIGISPGFVETDLTAGLRSNPATHQELTARIPAGRWGRVEEIGALALYLCGEQASYITGSDVVIDGGWLAL
jgi:NAD(P)-dependent dehydrogenase (short-subunit alcohol dehydrogenase family)